MTYQHPASLEELPNLLHSAAGQLYRSSDPDAFLAWITRAGPVLAPSLAAQVDPRTGPVGQFFRILGLQIYNITPLADYNFTQRPIPKPSRNQPCLCGSGRKYKRCCIDMDSQPILGDYNMLRHVLDHCSMKSLSTLPASQVDTEAVSDTATQWLAEGDTRRALALLEPWFRSGIPLKRRQRPLFDVLMDIYMEQGRTIKRKRLLERVFRSKDKQLRADALQRQATILLDNGDPNAAWESFSAAQRLDPNSPSLAMLEITLLCAMNDSEQAKARATFWLAHFRRRNDIPHEFLDLLAQCSEDPKGALLESMLAAHAGTEIEELIDLLQSAPQPIATYTLEPHNTEGILLPDSKLRKLENRWHSLAQPTKPSLTHTRHGDTSLWDRSSQWLPLLRQQPTLWHSFEVLDDLVLAVDALDREELVAPLLEPLLDRAAMLLDRNLEKATPSGRYTLPWLILENRPALRLLAHKVFHQFYDQEDSGPGFIKWAERLMALNPNDNHGIREALSTAYLSNAQYGKTIALAEQFSEDVLCTLPLNRVLALYLDNQKGKALSHLANIARRFTVALDMLLAQSPRPPKLSDHSVMVGGKDEAWLYRETTLPLWRQHGALTWLQQAFDSLRTQQR